MSLAKTIIYESDNEVARFLKTRPKLDIIDEYGYTPLIQAAIVNSVSKAKLILEAGAQVDFTDLTGRTALFWAADNDNISLCELCLQYKANPNAYSSGAQPVLVMPLMKNQSAIKKLLISAGARLNFAQDFLNAKLIGHSFELEGRVDIVNTNNTFIEVELEGFYLRFTLEIVATSLIDFKNNFGAKKMRKYFANLDTIINAFQTAIKLIKLQNYLIDVRQFFDKINTLLTNEPLILPISFGGHAITLIKFWDQFIRCDRGEFGRKNGTVIYYDIQNPARLTKSFCRELLYKRQHTGFINNGIIDYLGLQPHHVLELPTQKTGNCSWANVEAAIPAIMYLLLFEETNRKDPKGCEEKALHFYHEWREWNKTRSLDFCIQSLVASGTQRRLTKAALLAAILLQSCDYNNPKDYAKSNKILAVLSQPDHLQILKCYAKTFKQEKDNDLWKSFCNYLEDYGIEVEKLSK